MTVVFTLAALVVMFFAFARSLVIEFVIPIALPRRIWRGLVSLLLLSIFALIFVILEETSSVREVLAIVVFLGAVFMALNGFVIEKMADAAKGLIKKKWRMDQQDLANGLSHEINNPLAVVKMQSEYLEELIETQARPEECKEVLGDINSHVERIHETMKKIRVLSEDKTGEERGEVDVFATLETVLQAYRHRLEEDKFKVNFEAGEPLCITGRAAQLNQVFSALILNSIEAADEAREISVSVKEGDSQVVIQIEDFGKGIPSDVAEKIWRSFYSKKEQHMGLGLTLATTIVHDHGGEISLTNLQNPTAFKVSLPK